MVDKGNIGRNAVVRRDLGKRHAVILLYLIVVIGDRSDEIFRSSVLVKRAAHRESPYEHSDDIGFAWFRAAVERRGVDSFLCSVEFRQRVAENALKKGILSQFSCRKIRIDRFWSAVTRAERDSSHRVVSSSRDQIGNRTRIALETVELLSEHFAELLRFFRIIFTRSIERYIEKGYLFIGTLRAAVNFKYLRKESVQGSAVENYVVDIRKKGVTLFRVKVSEMKKRAVFKVKGLKETFDTFFYRISLRFLYYDLLFSVDH